MKVPLRELQEIANTACFINSCVLYSQDNFDWLKPYVLLYDHVVLDTRLPAGPTGEGIRSKSPISSWLFSNALFLEDFEDLPGGERLREYWRPIRVPPEAMPIIVTKKGVYNKAFLRTFKSKLQYRQGGATEYLHYFEIFAGSFLLKEASSITDVIFLQEIAHAWVSLHVSLAGGPPSIMDPLSAWLGRRVYGTELGLDRKFSEFRSILVRDVPDFTRLSWEDILDLRGSRNRRRCLAFIQQAARETESALRESIQSTLWRLATEAVAESSIPKEIIKGIVGELPGLPVNPVSIWMSLRDIYKAVRTEPIRLAILYRRDSSNSLEQGTDRRVKAIQWCLGWMGRVSLL